MVLAAISSVLSLLLEIAVGFYFAGKSWFGEKGTAFLSKLAVRVVIPCYMIYNVIHVCSTRADLLDMVRSVPIPLSVILFNLGLAFLLAFVMKVKGKRRGVFLNALTFTNTVVIGFPVVEAIFGEEILPLAMTYYMANTTMFWTVGVLLLRGRQEGQKIFSLKTLKSLLSPPLMGLLIGIAVVLSGLKLPDFLWSALTGLKNATTALCMLFIGGVLRQSGLKNLSFDRELVCISVTRFLITPLLMLPVCALLPAELTAKQVFYIMSTLPAMTQLGIMAKEADSDYTFASLVVTVTTILCMGMLPVFVWLSSIFLK